ncbi:MerR family transcriptional regulator [Microbacterium sp. LMI12-1-1.1]|uniref:MerR family transcriptional regulator n=1 Tax=unclassified Microbacterium TaxID=2609290 RepID=UPI0034350708
MSSGVTIGQAAAFVGVTVKTVRHYHKLGLIAEPERDVSGYRRYSADDLLRLVHVRTLAGAGVPLAEIAPLLAADGEEFAAKIGDVERKLAHQIEELIARRDTLRQLTDGDRALLPERAVALLERMPDLDFSPQEIESSREGLILAKALVPDRFDDHLAAVEHALQDPEFIALSRLSADSANWGADDPRIPELAAAMADHYLAHPEHLRIITGMQARTDTAARYRMVRDFGSDEGTAAERLVARVEARLREAGIRIPRPEAG